MFKFSVMEEFRKLRNLVKQLGYGQEEVLWNLKEIKMTQSEIKAILVDIQANAQITADNSVGISEDVNSLLDLVNNPSTENTMDAESLALLTAIAEKAAANAAATTEINNRFPAAVVEDPIVPDPIDPTL